MPIKILHLLRDVILLLALFTAIVFIPYHLAFAQKIIPGIRVGEIDLSGLTLEQGYEVLKAYFESLGGREVEFEGSTPPIPQPPRLNLQKPRRLFLGGVVLAAEEPNSATASASLKDLGVFLDPKETVVKAYRVGRSGNLFKDTAVKTRAYAKGETVKPVYALDEPVFEAKLKALFGRLEDPFVEASLVLDDQGQPVFESGKAGTEIDFRSLRDCVASSIESVEYHPRLVGGQAAGDMRCTVTMINREPSFTAADFERVKEDATRLAKKKITLVWEGGKKELSGSDLLALYAITKTGLLRDEEKVGLFVRNLAATVDKAPVNAAFEVKEGGQLAVFTQAKNGQRLNQEKLTEDLREVLSSLILKSETDAEAEVNAEVEILKSQVTSVANDYGIKDFLGVGVSYYPDSIPNRIHNIKLAVGKINGLLIKPGEIVSLNEKLGDVSSASGYKVAYIIQGNRTVLGVGGGVCQVPTTLFRTVLNAGLPVLERTAHAYRVHYYEPPLGMDATVMAPYTDFVFKNDTPAYLLIQTRIDEAKEEVTFEIFGTSDGRVTEVSKPAVTGETPPPPAIYQDDPSLDRGVTKQVDWAAWGATAKVTRRVTRNGEVLQEDEFVSKYTPWPAVFLVGTKE